MSIPLPNKPWNKGDTFTNPETNVEYVYDGVKWLSTGGDFGGGIIGGGDGNWSTLPTGNLVLKSNGRRPTGSANAGELHIWHLDPADCVTAPEQEFKVGWSGGSDIVDKFDEDDIGFCIKLVQGSLEMTMRGNGGGWMTDGSVWHLSSEQVSGDVLIADDPVELQIMYDVSKETTDWVNENFVNVTGDTMTGTLEVNDTVKADRVHSTRVDSGENSNLHLGRDGADKLLLGTDESIAYTPVKYNANYTLDDDRHLVDKAYVDKQATEAEDKYVQKESQTGDHMIGPFDVRVAPGTASRDSRRINTLGVFTNSDSSALRLGTTRDRVYIGHEDTSFNGPVKVNQIHEKNDGNGVEIHHRMWMKNNRISGLADPQVDADAVNLRTVEGKIDDLAENLRDRLDTLVTDNSAGEMKFSIVQAPSSNGQFTCMTANGSASTYDPLQTREIWANNNNLSGYDFGWGDVKPNSYFFMSGPGDALARFRVVADPVDQGTWTKIKVADAEVYPDGQQWAVNDVWDVLFRSFTGGNVNLDEYVQKSGDVMTGTLEAPRVDIKKNDVGVLLLSGNRSAPADAAARITMSNSADPNAYGSMEWHATTGNNGWFQFSNDVDLGSNGLHGVDHIRFKGSSKNIVEDTSVRVTFNGRTIVEKGNSNNNGSAGFEVKGKTDEGSNAKLLQVYHNNSSIDSVNYYGKTQADKNIATVGYVNSVVSGDSGDSGDTPFTPYGPMEIIPNGRVPSAGDISFGGSRPTETESIALHKTDKNGDVWDYQFGNDSIFTVTIVDEVGAEPFRQTISVRVDGVEDKGNFIVLTVDGRDLSCKQRDETTGDYYFVTDPVSWCLNWGAMARPLQKVPVTFDEIFQFRDESSVFPTFMKYRISTGSGDGFAGASRGRIYFEGRIDSPSSIRLCTRDAYDYGFLGRANKTSSTSIVSCPGEMTIFARSTWSKQIVPVEGYYFDSLYFNQSKSSMRLQNWGKSWDDGSHHTLTENETIFVKFDFTPKAHTTARMEQQIADLTARLAKLEGGE